MVASLNSRVQINEAQDEPADPGAGLSVEEAALRLARDGPNELPAAAAGGAWHALRAVVGEPMFLLLAGCGAIYLLLGDRHEALMLMGFVVVVMGITFVQRQRTEHSLAALRELSSPRAAVLRGGEMHRIAGRDVVCGDTVLLAEGDRVPADLMLLQTSHLAVDESLLTGESAPVMKHSAASGTPAGQVDALALACSGTLVTSGTARGCVVATGERSALGRIGASLADIASERTPIQQEVDRTVRRVAGAGFALALALALTHGLTHGDWLRGLLAGLTLAIALLPEELPVVLAIFMGLGAWRLARARVLVRSIPAVELLGATTVLCVDKTGTLTANRMSVRRLWTPEASHDTLRHRTDPAAVLPEALHEILEYAVLASHRRAFDPMESAIAGAGARLLAHTEHLHADWTLIDDYPLSNKMLAMSRVWQAPRGAARLIASKGSPEAIADLCHMDAQHHARISVEVARMASEGLRVLGVARSRFEAAELPGNQHDFDFEFLGLIGLEDPVRDDVPQALAECRAAGIRVVMMTGDHPVTAISVARQAGLPVNGSVLTGDELAALDDTALRARLADTHVFCRVRPEHKLRLVQAFRASGEVVAMTGDGVNDAPALKAAHIGVAMGARGTDVAREAASLVLLDDDFASIVTAIRDGRRVFANLRRAVVFLVAVHVPIVGLSMLPVALGWPMLLMPVHILFLQLIIDPTCSVVFEAEPLDAQTMTRPPRRPDARLFDAQVVRQGLWQGVGLLALLLAVCAGLLQAGAGADSARAMTFMVLVLGSLALIQSSRTLGQARAPGLHWALGGNAAFAWVAAATLALLGTVLWVPPIARLFAFGSPTPGALAVGAVATLMAIAWFELVKRLPGSGRGVAAAQ
ncbi:MAG: ATPase [Burkholderiales bacterium 28-67-8]|nr:MAG: ATPase [Burkholderiales bacterium 28-67-8]